MKMGRKQKGGEIVEFALLAPLLFVILFGIIEFSIALYDQAILTNISREGARYGITYQLDEDGNRITGATLQSNIESHIDTLLANATLISLGGASTPTKSVTTGTNAGDPITVEVDYDYQFLVFAPLVGLIGGTSSGSLGLGSTTIMRME